MRGQGGGRERRKKGKVGEGKGEKTIYNMKR